MIDRDTAETYEILANLVLRLGLTIFLMAVFTALLIAQIWKGFSWPASGVMAVLAYAMKAMFTYYFSHRPPKG
jgi:hypothetical protein